MYEIRTSTQVKNFENVVDEYLNFSEKICDCKTIQTLKKFVYSIIERHYKTLVELVYSQSQDGILHAMVRQCNQKPNEINQK